MLLSFRGLPGKDKEFWRGSYESIEKLQFLWERSQFPVSAERGWVSAMRLVMTYDSPKSDLVVIHHTSEAQNAQKGTKSDGSTQCEQPSCLIKLRVSTDLENLTLARHQWGTWYGPETQSWILDHRGMVISWFGHRGPSYEQTCSNSWVECRMPANNGQYLSCLVWRNTHLPYFASYLDVKTKRF